MLTIAITAFVTLESGRGLAASLSPRTGGITSDVHAHTIPLAAPTAASHIHLATRWCFIRPYYCSVRG